MRISSNGVRRAAALLGSMVLIAACSGEGEADTESLTVPSTQAPAETTVTSAEPVTSTSGGASESSDTTSAPTETGEPASEPIATAQGSPPFIELQIFDLRRVGETVTLEFAIVTDASARNDDTENVFAAPEDKYIGGGDNGVSVLDDRILSVSGVTLVDEANRKRHLVLRDSNGQCLCTAFVRFGLEPDTTYRHSAQFPAPPSDVEQMTVQVPTFPAIDAVPLQSAEQ